MAGLDLAALFPTVRPGSVWKVASDPSSASFVHNSDVLRAKTHGLADSVNGLAGSGTVTTFSPTGLHLEADVHKRIAFKKFGAHLATDIAVTGADQIRITSTVDGGAPTADLMAVTQARQGFLELRSTTDGSTSTITASPDGRTLVMAGSIPSDHSTFQITLGAASGR